MEAMKQVDELIEKLQDDDKKVRYNAVEKLGGFGQAVIEKAVPALIDLLHKEFENWDRANEIRKKSPSERNVIKQQEIYNDDSWITLLHSIVHALEKIGTPKAMEAVEEYKDKVGLGENNSA